MKTETCLTKRPFLMAYGGLNMFNALSTNVGTVLAVQGVCVRIPISYTSREASLNKRQIEPRRVDPKYLVINISIINSSDEQRAIRHAIVYVDCGT